MAVASQQGFSYEKQGIPGSLYVTVDDAPPILISFKKNVKVSVTYDDSQTAAHGSKRPRKAAANAGEKRVKTVSDNEMSDPDSDKPESKEHTYASGKEQDSPVAPRRSTRIRKTGRTGKSWRDSDETPEPRKTNTNRAKGLWGGKVVASQPTPTDDNKNTQLLVIAHNLGNSGDKPNLRPILPKPQYKPDKAGDKAIQQNAPPAEAFNMLSPSKIGSKSNSSEMLQKKVKPKAPPPDPFKFLNVFLRGKKIRRSKLRKIEYPKSLYLKKLKKDEKYFDPKDEKKHGMKGNEIPCEYCNTSFDNDAALREHTRSIQVGPHACLWCDKTFSYKVFKTVHEHSVHGLNSQASAPDLACDACDYKAVDLSDLNTHLRVHSSEFLHSCCLCGRQYVDCKLWKRHMTSFHKKGGKLRCSCCSQVFDSRGQLDRHRMAMTEFKCHFCGEVLPNRTSRNEHYKVFHDKEVFRCNKPLCYRMFSRQEDLVKHIKDHAKYKKQQCTICGKFFSRLDKHILTHETQVDQVFMCDQCPNSFNSRTSFERHLNTHKYDETYKCPHCPQTFADCALLRSHLKRHNKLKQHKCDICQKSFNRMDNFNKHKRIHAKTKYLFCPVCEQGFNYKATLENHMHTQHSQTLASYPTAEYTTRSAVEVQSQYMSETDEVYEAAQQLQRFARMEPRSFSSLNNVTASDPFATIENVHYIVTDEHGLEIEGKDHLTGEVFMTDSQEVIFRTEPGVIVTVSSNNI